MSEQSIGLLAFLFSSALMIHSFHAKATKIVDCF